MLFTILNNVAIYKQRIKFKKQNIDNKMNEIDSFKNGEVSKNNIFFVQIIAWTPTSSLSLVIST